MKGDNPLFRALAEDPKGLLEHLIAKEARMSGSRSFAAFAKQAWPIFEPASLMWGWHMDAICEHLEALARGQLRRLVVNVPPRTSKSSLASILFPCWVWTWAPKTQFMYLSYAATLSVEHSVKCRQVIESPWYRQTHMVGWQLAQDQNVKHDFVNTLGGRRRATSIDGGITGHGADLICLRGDVKITTDRGEIPIRDIVEERLPVRVLGSSGRWQEIEAYEKNVGRPLVEITLDNGRILVCTEDHPIFVRRLGFVPATDVIYNKDDRQLLGLREEFRSIAEACAASEQNFLLPEMFERGAERGAQRLLERGHAVARVPSLPSEVWRGREGVGMEEVLLHEMQRICAAGETPARMPYVQGLVHPEGTSGALLSSLCRSGAANQDPRFAERAVHGWALGDEIQTRFHEAASLDGSSARWVGLRPLQSGGSGDSGSPYRRVEGQSRAYELGDALHSVSPEGPHARDLAPMDEAVRIVAVRSCATPDHVYNLRVAPDHDYYANGILTHNCIDDPIGAEDAYSKSARDRAWRVVSEAISTRFNDPRTGRGLCIMQRFHEDDPAQRLVDMGWTHLMLPMEAEIDRRCVTRWTRRRAATSTEPAREEEVEWRDPRERAGDLLMPGRIPSEEIERIKASLGAFAWASQFQQRPAPEDGGIFKVENWRFWSTDQVTMQRLGHVGGVRPRGCYEGPARVVDLGRELETQIVSVDATFRETKEGSFVAIHVWARSNADRLLLYRVHRRMDFTDTVKDLLRVISIFPEARRKLIEGKANGDAIISALVRTHGISGCEAVPVSGSKLQRAHAMQPHQSSGHVLLPDGAPWLAEYIVEHAQFPNGTHDDDVDAQSQGLAGLEAPARAKARSFSIDLIAR